MQGSALASSTAPATAATGGGGLAGTAAGTLGSGSAAAVAKSAECASDATSGAGAAGVDEQADWDTKPAAGIFLDDDVDSNQDEERVEEGQKARRAFDKVALSSGGQIQVVQWETLLKEVSAYNADLHKKTSRSLFRDGGVLTCDRFVEWYLQYLFNSDDDEEEEADEDEDDEESETADDPSAIGIPASKLLKLDLEAIQSRTLPSLDKQAARADAAMATRDRSRLRVVTWNVWFDSLDADARYAALFEEALLAAPDVLCLQEVLPALARSIRCSSALSTLYDISPNPIASYGCLLLVRRELGARFREVRLPSTMDRSLLVAECAFGAVATVHLESLNSEPTRREQLRQCALQLSRCHVALLCGDMNFDSSRTWGEWRDPRAVRPKHKLENRVLSDLLPTYVDAWQALRPGEPGCTFDGATNPHVRNPEEVMRYDRVLVCGARPCHTELLGARQSPGAIVPSDHYGVQVDVLLE